MGIQSNHSTPTCKISFHKLKGPFIYMAWRKARFMVIGTDKSENQYTKHMKNDKFTEYANKEPSLLKVLQGIG